MAQLVGDVSLSFDKKEPTAAVLLDISKAFDTVDHAILIHKLDYIGIRGKALQWITSYLGNRTQIVKLNNAKSDSLVTNCGVPQGSVLGPLLYSIYTNDAFTSLKHCKLVQFADDSTLYIGGQPEVTIPKLNSDLASFMDWCRANKLSLSPTKTCAIQFRRTGVPDSNTQISLNNTNVPIQDSVKLLGLYLDHDLSWTSHLFHLRQKLAS